MMKASFALLRIYFILYFTVFCTGQRFRVCDAGSECILIRTCPEMVKLVQSGIAENISLVRKAICGFERRNSLVCCPTSGSISNTTPAPTPPILSPNNEDLLPKKGSCGRPSTEDRIINGTPAPIGGYPWLAAFGYTEPGTQGFAFVCAGSIINSKYVLTAAHCVNRADIGRKRLAVIHLGDWDLSTSPDCQVKRRGTKCSEPHIVAGYEEIIMHPDYNTRGRSSDDIALIRLNITLDFDSGAASIEPICLPSSNVDVRALVGTRHPIAAGWGLTEHGNNSNIMLRVNVPLTDDQKCRDRYNRDFVGNQLCVGGEGGFDTCSGDSGGPLILSEPQGPPFTQIGIVSFGPFPCGLQNFPGVYTSVKDYKSWILETIRA